MFIIRFLLNSFSLFFLFLFVLILILLKQIIKNSIIPAIFHVLYYFFEKIESPKWLIMKGKFEEAEQMMRKIHISSNISEQIEEIVIYFKFFF